MHVQYGGTGCVGTVPRSSPVTVISDFFRMPKKATADYWYSQGCVPSLDHEKLFSFKQAFLSFVQL